MMQLKHWKHGNGQKTDMDDEIFVINVGEYIGESIRSEIEYEIECGFREEWRECNGSLSAYRRVQSFL